MTKELKMMAVNDGPKNYSRLAYIGEFVEVRNLDSEGVKIDIQISDQKDPHLYIGIIADINGLVAGYSVGDEVEFPQHCVFRCFDKDRKQI